MPSVTTRSSGSDSVVTKDRVVIRFAGDSGDGMQLTGDRFTSETAAFGNDLSTLPNFPAEIPAPAGTLPGVSSFQLHFANYDILTPGDRPDVLVAMNPAALKANVSDLPHSGVLIVNTDEFTNRNLAKVGYESNPLEDDSLTDYQVHEVAMATLTRGALEGTGLSKKDAERAKNMFALGLLSWIYHRPQEGAERFLREKFAKRPELAEANILALRAGHTYGETTEAFAVTYEVALAKLDPGTYRQITGSTAMAYGIVAAGQTTGLPAFLGSYPITPASDILHELSKHKCLGVTTFQAEDEIAGVGAALGASFGGSLGVTTTSGPGLSLKSETVGLAVALELPLLAIDVQRGGPSTGLPTKTEQADLLQAMYGRNGEAPLPIIAPNSPGDCFHASVEAAAIAVMYRTPVIVLSDGALDSDPKCLTEVLGAAAEHRGTALVEIFQDCPIFNDGSFNLLRKPETKDQRLITIRDGKPTNFGADNEFAVVQRGLQLKVAKTAEAKPGEIVTQDASNHELAFALSRLSDQDLDHTVTGIFRNVDRTTYDDAVRAQLLHARDSVASKPAVLSLQSLLTGHGSWTVADWPQRQKDMVHDKTPAKGEKS